MDTKGKITPDLNDKENPWGSKYNEAMCLEIIQMFSEGKTRSQFCARHTIGNDTFERWRAKHPLFNAACIAAHDKARAYYDEMRDRHLINEIDLDSKTMTGINHAIFNRMYNTRFNIPEKRAVKVKGLGKAKDEKAMLKCLMAAVEAQELTPDEAQKLASLIDVSIKVDEHGDLKRKVMEIVQAKAIGADNDGFKEVPDDTV